MMVACSAVSAFDVGGATAAALDALRGVAPSASARAARALDTILDAWRESGAGPHGGRLTSRGFPIEIVCSTTDAAVRYTCDVAGPAAAPASRLPAAQALLRSLGVDRPFPLPSLQAGSVPLRWGAWLGGRHQASSDSYKLYAEAPAFLSTPAIEELREALGHYRGLLDSHVLSLRLVGVDVLSGRLECYFGARGLNWRQLQGLMAFAGMAHRQPELRLLLDDVAGAEHSERLLERGHGFSISLPSGAPVDTFSVFTLARVLFGSTAMVRQGVLACAARQRWNMAAYAAVSAPLADRHQPDEHHGLVSFVARHAGPLGFGVGLRPPLSHLPAR